jgi:AcrR family transcriptional regulator
MRWIFPAYDSPEKSATPALGMFYAGPMAWDTQGTRRRLKAAATAEFAEHGLAGTTMTGIAARAGINKERLYTYYGDKDALWKVVLTEELDRLASAVALTGIGIEDIGNFAGATYDYHATHPELGRLLQWEGLTRRPGAARGPTGLEPGSGLPGVHPHRARGLVADGAAVGRDDQRRLRRYGRGNRPAPRIRGHRRSPPGRPAVTTQPARSAW